MQRRVLAGSSELSIFIRRRAAVDEDDFQPAGLKHGLLTQHAQEGRKFIRRFVERHDNRYAGTGVAATIIENFKGQRPLFLVSPPLIVKKEAARDLGVSGVSIHRFGGFRFARIAMLRERVLDKRQQLEMVASQPSHNAQAVGRRNQVISAQMLETNHFAEKTNAIGLLI